VGASGTDASVGGATGDHHTTFVGDTFGAASVVTGSALRIVDGNVNVYNTIIDNHATGISAAAPSVVVADNNLFFGNDTDVAGVVPAGPHDASGDPLFADPAHDDYHLSGGSPAIDGGQPASVDTDIDGDPRPSGLTRPFGGVGYDIGYDEYVPKAMTGLSVVVSPLPATMLGAPTTFTAHVNGGTSPITYTWDFGDNTPVQTGVQAPHLYAGTGVFTATVSARNSEGQATTTVLVTVIVPPSARRLLYLPSVSR
jgi:PKD repeat protein